MNIKVILYMDFKQLSPDPSGCLTLDAPPGADVQWVLKRLCIPSEKEKIVLVDGRHRSGPEPLHDGETVSIFPVLEGG